MHHIHFFNFLKSYLNNYIIILNIEICYIVYHVQCPAIPTTVQHNDNKHNKIEEKELLLHLIAQLNVYMIIMMSIIQ